MPNILSRHALSFGLSLSLALACGLGPVAQAANEAPHRTEVQRAIDVIGPMNRAWRLEFRCHSLSDDLRWELEWHLTGINGRLMQEGGWPAIRETIRAAVAEAKTANCNETARQAIAQALVQARELNEELNGASFEGRRSIAELWTVRFLMHAQAAGIAERCSYGPEGPRRDFIKLVTAIGESLTTITEASDLVARGAKARSSARNSDVPACSPDLDRSVRNALVDARALGVELGLWDLNSGFIENN